jgi:ribonuclease P protein component
VEQAAGRPHALPARLRIRRRPEFLRVYEHGFRVRARLMTVVAHPNVQGPSRLGIAATRKLGGAVVRNRAKRLVRELFRNADVPQGLDIVIIPRPDMLDADFRTLESEFRYALRRAGRPQGTGR